MITEKIGYWVLFFLFAFELAISVALLKLVIERLKALAPPMYWWAQEVFLFQSVISVLAFLSLTDPLQAFIGYPLAMWLLAGHSASVAQIACWALVFHTQRWANYGKPDPTPASDVQVHGV